MNCPFMDSSGGVLCMVLKASGDLMPVCMAEQADRPDDKSFRNCEHYDAILSGGLIRIVRRSRKSANNRIEDESVRRANTAQ